MAAKKPNQFKGDFSICRAHHAPLLRPDFHTGVFVFASQITSIFNSENDPFLQTIAIEGLRLYFIACPFAGFNIILSMFFTSIERPRPAHGISLLRGFFVIIPMALILSRVANLQGVWCAFPATELLVSGIALAFYRSWLKKENASAISLPKPLDKATVEDSVSIQ